MRFDANTLRNITILVERKLLRLIRPCSPDPVVFLYHTIGCYDPHISVSSEKFASQMRSLREREIRVYSLQEAYTSYSRREPFASQSVLLTFDDGYADNYTEVFPVLVSHGFPAVFFINTDYIGQTSRWNHRSAFEQLLLNKEQIRSMARQGMEFGSHGTTHQNLLKVPDDVLISQLKESKKILEDLVQKEVYAFSYPYGAFDERVKQCVKSVFSIAFSVDKGSYLWREDLFAVRRIPVTEALSLDKLI